MRPTDAACVSIWPSEYHAKFNAFAMCTKTYENRPRNHQNPPKVPTRLPEDPYYGTPRHRLVGYDNERGKSDHRHVHGKEETYAFSTPEQLIEDFLADVRRVRGES